MENSEDLHLMADSCATLLQSLYGNNNWYRWNEIKQQTQLSNTQSFVTWLLDVAEQEIKRQESQLSDEYRNKNGDGVEVLEFNTSHVDTATTGVDSELPAGESVWKESSLMDDGYKPGFISGPLDKDYPIKEEDSGHLFSQPSVSEVSPMVELESPKCSLNISARGINEPFFCEVCQVSLSGVEIVKEHRNLRHQSSTVFISCQCCQQHYESVNDYVAYHRQTAILNNPAAARYICNKCAKGFRSKQRLSDHIANTHEKAAPKYECPYCQKKISHASNVSTHKKKCNLAPRYV